MNHCIIKACLLAALIGCEVKEVKVEEWEHGFLTKNVIGTRYVWPDGNYTLGFRFPNHIYESDRTETFDFLVDNGCRPYEGGGFPGAEVKAFCGELPSKDAASAFLVSFLPKLDAHIRQFRGP